MKIVFTLLTSTVVALGLAQVGYADETVATVAGTPITRAALEAHVKPQLIELDSQRYDALKQGLDAMIAEELVSKEAKASGKTVDELLEAEIMSKVSEPSDDAVKKMYEANKKQLGDASFDEVRPRIVEFLKGQEAQEKQAAFLASLRAKYAVTVKLKAPVVEIGDGGRPAKGSASAPITIIEFSDYECPYCKRAEPSVAKVLETYGDKVRLVFRDYPLPFHANAKPAAMAAACAEDQGKFWEYHDKLFTASALNEETYRSLAGEVGLDQGSFDECLASEKHSELIDKDIADASAVGVRGTPAFFINGRMISGAQPFEKFKEIIDEELAQSGTS